MNSVRVQVLRAHGVQVNVVEGTSLPACLADSLLPSALEQLCLLFGSSGDQQQCQLNMRNAFSQRT